MSIYSVKVLNVSVTLVISAVQQCKHVKGNFSLSSLTTFVIAAAHIITIRTVQKNAVKWVTGPGILINLHGNT